MKKETKKQISEEQIKQYQDALEEYNKNKPAAAAPNVQNWWVYPQYLTPCPCGRCPYCGRIDYLLYSDPYYVPPVYPWSQPSITYTYNS